MHTTLSGRSGFLYNESTRRNFPGRGVILHSSCFLFPFVSRISNMLHFPTVYKKERKLNAGSDPRSSSTITIRLHIARRHNSRMITLNSIRKPVYVCITWLSSGSLSVTWTKGPSEAVLVTIWTLSMPGQQIILLIISSILYLGLPLRRRFRFNYFVKGFHSQHPPQARNPQ